MLKNLAIALTMSLAAARPGQAADVAITLDDLPYAVPSRVSPQEGLAIVEAINRTLGRYGVIATGFAIGQKVNPDSLPALLAFVHAGHGLGNHSWSHPDYNRLTPEEFRTETARADQGLADWLTDGKYYRFPFLHQGETSEKREAAAAILAQLGYQNVPVSIDNDEYQFNDDYMKALAKGGSKAAREIAGRYLQHMQERTGYFQALAKDKLGRDIKHILLLHMNRINADHLDDLLGWYKAQGWSFITVQEALMDPVYSAEDHYVGPKGLSQIERVTTRP
ncbi:polysaccharide deacetylase family protein [Inquilinus limosus]|uniref:polysaccharide deacetylase family protein n=1 Tax=Inquilinus limosus TaxID=171674 RepID=UPI003F150F14